MALWSAAAGAQDTPPVVVETYSRDRVIPLAVALGYATLIELASDESVENVVVGDGASWQVTPTTQGNRVVVKPMGGGAMTDLIITTATRRYVFLLSQREAGAIGPFVVRFDYPPPAQVPDPGMGAGRYDLKGAAELFPAAMSDDGARTVITWPSHAPLPAMFALDVAGKETMINGRMIGPSYVVEGVSARYVFRRDLKKAVAVRRSAAVVRR